MPNDNWWKKFLANVKPGAGWEVEIKLVHASASQADSIGMPGRLVSDVESEDETVFDDKPGFRRWFAWHRVVIDGSPAWLCWVERRWLDRYHDDGFWEYRRVPNRLVE